MAKSNSEQKEDVQVPAKELEKEKPVVNLPKPKEKVTLPDGTVVETY